ncbi:fumarylacetoacetate hydrolase family protein [Streptomyces sp. NBC_01239]|uniref:fumarylacetoacetate hydrolase family protein n=1 Tax=Streptomyces sp. NBC_01239 TaxID=2903792 RepID=UPI00225536DD|nr:fumarylacetoacetate hydrolase family protein [Streptomyces sp. NBC_01239]MCX4817972.1 fumarylacetoacetate hydrolase family protein [Streptomyces sp. NBC_01239]
MKIVKFYTAGSGTAPPGRRTGALTGGRVVDLAPLVTAAGADLRTRPAELLIGDVLALGASELKALDERVQEEAGRESATTHRLGEVELLPPVEAQNKVLCQVVNYRAHGQEADIRPPAKPFFFYKPYSSLATDGSPLWEIEASRKLDFECELVMVIGRTAKNVSQQEAMSHVAAYAVMNDVSYRDLQFNEDAPSLNASFGRNWTKGKGLDGACVIGPWLTTADEVGDPYRLELTTQVNGLETQSAMADEMLLRLPQLVHEASVGATLHPGDVIATGTPAGVGLGSGQFLEAGDEVVCSVSGLGSLRNKVVLENDAGRVAAGGSRSEALIERGHKK